MRPIVFCDRCRGMEVGPNRKYLIHRLFCRGGISNSVKVLIYVVASALVISLFPTTTAIVISNQDGPLPIQPQAVGVERIGAISDPAISAIEELLGRHSRVDSIDRARIARAVVASARKYDVDPFLVASILLVESSGNPFAISGREAVGIMQIHLPTWGSLVDVERINLFRVEDNVDLGTRILKDYTVRYGLWDGVMRYLGGAGDTEENLAYVRRVQGIYSDRQAD